ncbi:arginase family protein [Microcella sp.]|uniref:arginase family protein n=1 Tax=Microcella sp. TaxID=1913979 RepID=UPI00299F66E7|nr:arginase family protein [Microcella sp.]MDX2025004.1 arginase family protein [Microcella sp.]
MSATFVVVPQWQGSGSSRAMRLVDGAAAIRADLPSSATREIEVPLEAGDSEGTGILRYSSIRLVRERLERALAELDDTPVIIGGDCGVEYAGIEHASRAGRVVLLWADAHADLNTAESSPSKAFHGMVLRSLVDAGVVAAADVLLLGVRDLDDAEAQFIEASGMPHVTASEVGDRVAERVAAARADGVEPVLYVHVDLDVLDPSVFGGVGFPAPFGLALDELTGAVAAARAHATLIGAGLTEFAPAPTREAVPGDSAGAIDESDEASGAASDELTVILRILAALSR